MFSRNLGFKWLLHFSSGVRVLWVFQLLNSHLWCHTSESKWTPDLQAGKQCEPSSPQQRTSSAVAHIKWLKTGKITPGGRCDIPHLFKIRFSKLGCQRVPPALPDSCWYLGGSELLQRGSLVAGDSLQLLRGQRSSRRAACLWLRGLPLLLDDLGVLCET